MRLCLEDFENTPLKRTRDPNNDVFDPLGASGCLTQDLRASNESIFRSSLMDTQLLMMSQCRDTINQDDYSSTLCSQTGSPFRKARRTRDERRKTVTTYSTACKRHDRSEEKVVVVNDENMINVSPLKKRNKQHALSSPCKALNNV